MRRQQRRGRAANAQAQAAARWATRNCDRRASGSLRFPEPQPCGKVPLTADGLTKAYGSLEVFSGVDLAIDRGARVVIIGLNRGRKDNDASATGGRRAKQIAARSSQVTG